MDALSCKPAARGIVYIRKSNYEQGLGPQNQLEWALNAAKKLGVPLDASMPALDDMVKNGLHVRGDIFLDFGISGSLMSRPGFDAMLRRAVSDESVTHVFFYLRDRFARPDDPAEAMRLENSLRRAGKTLVFSDKLLGPVKRGSLPIGEQIVSLIEYDASGKYLVALAERVIRSQIALAKAGCWAGGNAPYGFKRVLVGPDGQVVRDLQRGERVRQPGYHT
ncbi:MAG TPA: hypothetical protein DCX07_13950 [Phycisphaerales bacterium]|nr:hypothetical protein [Phycisphaerales bacterium]